MGGAGHNLGIGKRGEAAVCRYLAQKGVEIICTNYHCRYGEIDIIARSGDTVLFVEVKTRTGKRFGSAAEAVTGAKQKKVIRSAQHYILENETIGPGFRFDVAEVYIYNDEVSINYIEHAFY